jgi:hypothetical protein
MKFEPCTNYIEELSDSDMHFSHVDAIEMFFATCYADVMEKLNYSTYCRL